jgi:hypothetical protein
MKKIMNEKDIKIIEKYIQNKTVSEESISGSGLH